MGPAELPHQRDPCELPAYSGPNFATHQCEVAENSTTPGNAAAWQRHYPSTLTRGRSTGAGRISHNLNAPIGAVPSIGTPVHMVRAPPSDVRDHSVTPSKVNGHSYRAINIANTALLSPQSTLSHSFSRDSPPVPISPTGSSATYSENPQSVRHSSTVLGHPNNLLGHGYNSSNNSAESYFKHQQCYTPTISPVSPITCFDSILASPDYRSYTTLVAMNTHPHSPACQFLGTSEHVIGAMGIEYAPTAIDHMDHPIANIENRLDRSAQPRNSAWERFINQPPSYDPFHNLNATYMSQLGSCTSSFQSNDTLSAYEGRRTVSIRSEARTDRRSQQAYRPHIEQGGVAHTTIRASRAIMKKIFQPLPCIYCRKPFNGKYQKANRKRHVKTFHAAEVPATEGIDDGRECRTCFKQFRRTDARRKHEWKTHGAEYSRPIKRHIEKRDGQR